MNKQFASFWSNTTGGTEELDTEQVARTSFTLYFKVTLRYNSGQQSDHEMTNVGGKESTTA